MTGNGCHHVANAQKQESLGTESSTIKPRESANGRRARLRNPCLPASHRFEPFVHSGRLSSTTASCTRNSKSRVRGRQGACRRRNTAIEVKTTFRRTSPHRGASQP